MKNQKTSNSFRAQFSSRTELFRFNQAPTFFRFFSAPCGPCDLVAECIESYQRTTSDSRPGIKARPAVSTRPEERSTTAPQGRLSASNFFARESHQEKSCWRCRCWPLLFHLSREFHSIDLPAALSQVTGIQNKRRKEVLYSLCNKIVGNDRAPSQFIPMLNQLSLTGRIILTGKAAGRKKENTRRQLARERGSDIKRQKVSKKRLKEKDREKEKGKERERERERKKQMKMMKMKKTPLGPT